MALKTKSLRGTRDVVPAESYKWQYLERVALEVATSYGLKQIRIPTIEKTELFIKSVGETTDVVQKEMYTFDMGRESITLRPEGTAGTIRAVMENGLLNDVLPIKTFYFVSCFRHENPQSGRLREHNQFGVECVGCPSPSADAEVIGLVKTFFDRLGLRQVSLQINSIGCPDCRPKYNQELVNYFRKREDELCDTCKVRLEKNPLRLLDCKVERCGEIAAGAPSCLDYLCDDCQEHFDGLKARLDAMGFDYKINPRIVRGLDYYSRTVFEFISDSAGAQGTVCGGGRYDGLVEYMGGPPTPALGFGMGFERLLMVMEAEGCQFPAPKRCDIYIGSMGEKENIKALEICTGLRDEGFMALCDTVGRSVKAQMKYADKIGARYSCILGSQELENRKVTVKNMETGQQTELDITEIVLISENKIASDMLGIKPGRTATDAFKDFLYGEAAGAAAGDGEPVAGLLGSLLGETSPDQQ